MQDQEKTKEQLIDELNEMRRKVVESDSVQKSLTESELRYREILDKTNEGIFVIQDGWIKFANEKASEITGYSKEEALASAAIAAFVHPEDQEMLAQYHARRLQGDESHYQYPFRFIRKDGTVGWVEMNSSLIMWEGKPAALCLMAGITERKQAEEALRSSEERFRTLFETANDAIFLSDGPKFIECNAKVLKMFGCEEEKDIVGHSPMEFSPEKQPDGLSSAENAVKYLNAVLNSGPQTFYWKHCRKDGSLFDAEVSINALTLNGNAYFLGIVRDITERKQVEMALRENEERFSNFLNASNDLVFIKDPRYRYLFVNKANQEFFGLSEREIIGKTDFELMPVELARKCLESDQRAIAENNTVTEEQRSTDRIFETRKFPVKLAYQEVGVGAFIRDITDRKRAEEALRASEERFRAVIENLQIGISVLNPSMEIVAVNQFFQKIYPRVEAGTRQLCFEYYRASLKID